MTVRTRFAPSPTGYMHIGGMRTALFNWLFARRHGGQFLLRIDDTDQQRNVDEALGPILQSFKWLGLEWDEGPEIGGPHGPYFQSQRTELYRAAVQQLLESGNAYKCFETPEQIAADREAAQKEKRNFLNMRRSLELTPAQIEEKEAAGETPVIRLLVPRERKVAFTDAIRGNVEFDCGQIPDPVIMRANGSPLYNFATTVDDAAMQITHVIRAEEHLSNTPVQHLIYEALGYELPSFAHIPYVAAPGTKEKLSKRKLEQYRKNPQFKKMFEAADRVFPRIGLAQQGGLDPVMVEYYEQIGYLPDAVFNALARIGWSLDDKTENMSRETVINNFSLDRVVKAPAGLDPDKLDHFQAYWMSQLPADRKLAGCLEYLKRAKLIEDPVSDETKDLTARVIELLGDRIKLFSDILDADYFFKTSLCPEDYDEKALRKRVAKEGVPELLRALSERLNEVSDWTAETLEANVQSFASEQDASTGLLIPALRIAVSGKQSGPELYEMLALIGKERCIGRIATVIEAQLRND
ncbi:MAG TPA: glutamate--tRNA ligase [Planctomycetaceae bacterium]|nr:glutamate--tRNA ligase [Planctomycetaceae bacterium]